MSIRNKVAIAGYAHSRVERHAGQTLGALAVETARAAIADAGLQVADVDGFVGSTLLPTAGGLCSARCSRTTSAAPAATALTAIATEPGIWPMPVKPAA